MGWSEHYRILHAARNHITFEESISYLFPEISKEWHLTKNHPLLQNIFYLDQIESLVENAIKETIMNNKESS